MSTLESTAISRKNTTCATHCMGGPSAGQFVNQMVANTGREHAGQQRRSAAPEIGAEKHAQHERQQRCLGS